MDASDVVFGSWTSDTLDGITLYCSSIEFCLTVEIAHFAILQGHCDPLINNEIILKHCKQPVSDALGVLCLRRVDDTVRMF